MTQRNQVLHFTVSTFISFKKKLPLNILAFIFFVEWAREFSFLLPISMQKLLCVCACVCVCVQSLSCVQLFTTPWTILVTHQAPPSMRFSRQEYWSGQSFPSPEDLSDSGMEPRSPALQVDFLLSHQGSPAKLLQ